MNKQKTQAAISRLSKALEGCAELGLRLTAMPPKALQVGDHVLHEGKLPRVVARDAAQPNRVGLDDGRIVELSGAEVLVLRG